MIDGIFWVIMFFVGTIIGFFLGYIHGRMQESLCQEEIRLDAKKKEVEKYLLTETITRDVIARLKEKETVKPE